MVNRGPADGSACWQRGSLAAVQNYAFEVRGEPKVRALIASGNESSRRVAERLGMTYEMETELNGKGINSICVSLGKAAAAGDLPMYASGRFRPRSQSADFSALKASIVQRRVAFGQNQDGSAKDALIYS